MTIHRIETKAGLFLCLLMFLGCSNKSTDKIDDKKILYIEEINFQLESVETNYYVKTNKYVCEIVTRPLRDYIKYTNKLRGIKKLDGEDDMFEYFKLISKYPPTSWNVGTNIVLFNRLTNKYRVGDVIDINKGW